MNLTTGDLARERFRGLLIEARRHRLVAEAAGSRRSPAGPARTASTKPAASTILARGRSIWPR
jgi:hypothetical protein